MKKPQIPAVTILACSLTGCIDKILDSIDENEDDLTERQEGEQQGDCSDGVDNDEDGQTDCDDSSCSNKPSCTNDEDPVDPDTAEDTDVTDPDNITGLENVLGEWTLDSYSYSYGTYSYSVEYPTSDSDSLQEYGVEWTSTSSLSLFMNVKTSGIPNTYTSIVYNADLISFDLYTTVMMIDGVQIYDNTIGSSELREGFASIGEATDSYSMILEGGEELSCTLTGDQLSCTGQIFNLEFSADADIPVDIEDINENYPSTPQYTKIDCVDQTISTTGDAVEWGGFDAAGDDFGFDCAETAGYFDWDTYSYVDGAILEDTEELVFAFEAPNDGCFAFNTTGTNFTHGIQLISACDATEVLSCSTTGETEYELESGQQVLVVIDGEQASEQLFNLSITELSASNNAGYDILPANTSSLDTTAWVDEFDSSCAPVGAAKTFRWTAPSTGIATFDLGASDFDTVIQVEASGCGSLSECDDDGHSSGGLYTSLLEVSVEQGVEYLVTLGGYNGDSGILSMSITIN